MDTGELLKVFGYGAVLGSGPCLASCLPVVLPYITAKGAGLTEALKLTLLFTAARIAAYTALSVLFTAAFGLANSLFQAHQAGCAHLMKTATGIVLVALGAWYLAGRNLSLPLGKIPERFLAARPGTGIFVIGLLTGLSPCAPLLGMLAYIAATADGAAEGAALGIAFGLGTCVSPLVPAGIFAGALSERLTGSPRAVSVLRAVSAVLMMAVGFTLFLGKAG